MMRRKSLREMQPHLGNGRCASIYLPVGTFSFLRSTIGPGRYDWENSSSLEADARAADPPEKRSFARGNSGEMAGGACRMQRAWSVDEGCDSRRMEGLFRLGVDWLVTGQGSEAECLSGSSPALMMPNRASTPVSSTWLPAKRKENRGQKRPRSP
jgi:hypothetical protein